MFTSPFELLLRLRFVFAVVVVTRADVGELWVRVLMMLRSTSSVTGNCRHELHVALVWVPWIAGCD